MDPSRKLEGKRILIVDDEPDVLETLEELLDICLIDTAPSFDTAQKFLKNNTYDAALLDIMGVRGYDLLELAKEKGVPALMLTAHALNPDNLVRSIRRGAQSYIPKDKLADIMVFLADIIEAREQHVEKQTKWFARLRPFFDRKFGPEWREKHESFWREFDETPDTPVSKDEIEGML
jgi:DNA-binding NtrC family response regulator